MKKNNENKFISIKYTNYRNKTEVRKILPKRIHFGSTEWHKTEQWLLDAYDVSRDADRSFAMKDIKEWVFDS